MRGKVAFHLYPLALWPKLREKIPASLALVGKYRFDFEAIDNRKFAALEKLVAIAYERWEDESSAGTVRPVRSRR